MLRIITVILLFGLAAVISFSAVLATGNTHGNYSPDTDTCAGCHRSHTGPAARLLTSSAQGDAFCLTCHNGTGAPANPSISTHANIDFANGVEAPFQLQCRHCHDPHGGYNLYSIRDDVFVSINPTPITSGPVVFVATSGMGSYDDGISDPTSRICVTCHDNSSNPGYPVVNHIGGGSHQGGNEFFGSDCIVCHPHSADADGNTLDGFMPSGGCTLCHSTPQDNGDGFPVGGRRAVVDEFENSSHHVGGQVENPDCVACHDMTAHQAGQVQLFDADDPAALIVLAGDPWMNPTESAKLETFCLACHDADGAGGLAPFSDNVMPPVIDPISWNMASHASSVTCYDCHANGHGSAKENLLAPWDAVPDGSLPDDPLREEEGLCYTCHDADGPATADNQSQFGLSSHHNVGSSEQGDGSKVECINCHNPHMVNATNLTSNPDDYNVLWMGSDTDLCLACHDGDPPTGVTFPSNASGTGYDKSSYLTSTHDTNLGDYGCLHCHDQHGSDNVSTLLDQYEISEYVTYSSSMYQVCWTCHLEDSLIPESSRNAFDDLHKEHVDSESTACIDCHDVHAPHDTGETGLINLEFGVGKGWFTYWDDHDASSVFYIEENRGYCWLNCHDKEHEPKDYDRTPTDTHDCTNCHPAGSPDFFIDGEPDPTLTETLPPTVTESPTPTIQSVATHTPSIPVTLAPSASGSPTPNNTATHTPNFSITPTPTP